MFVLLVTDPTSSTNGGITMLLRYTQFKVHYA